MSVVDIEGLLQAVSADAPCGEDLEYDPACGELERAIQGKPEQQIGDTIVPSEEPDWRDVKARAVELFPRTKDLRVAVWLVRALVETEGVPGLRDGLALIEGMLDRYWEAVHPQLDPEDNNDPTLRVNTIASICDSETMLRSVRMAPLVDSPTFGRFTIRDVQMALGLFPVPTDVVPPDLSSIDAAFMDCEVSQLEHSAEAVGESIKNLKAIESLLTDRVGVAQAADLSALADLLKSVQKILSDRLESRGMGKATPPVEPAAEPAARPVAESSAPPGRPVVGAISSREDAIRALDTVCEYFKRHEPSSPVPLLLQRAKRLISKSFVEIMQDLAPNGLSQVELIRGVDTEEGSGK